VFHFSGTVCTPQTRHFQHLVDEKKKWVIIDSEISLDLGETQPIGEYVNLFNLAKQKQ